MKQIFNLFAFMILAMGSYAQNAGKISGSIKEGISQKAITASSISLLKAKDSSLVKLSVSDNNGNFLFESVNEDQYLVLITSSGYNKVYSEKFEISVSSPTKELGALQLFPVEKSLAAVKVVSKRPVIEVKADRVVFNVENSINSTGSNAYELLQKSPGVVIDNNENITMKGKSGVKIYIDGKITQLDSKSLADYLKGINSSDIESIEMISNPGAKYDASGNAGIINIKLKKNKKFGTNGNASLGYVQGKTPKGNASVSLNYRNKKINLFSNVSGYLGNNQALLKLYRLQSDSIYDQQTTMLNKRKNANIKVGADYFLNSKNTIGFMITSNLGGGSFNTQGNTKISYAPTNEYIKTLQATNTVPTNRNNNDFNVNYRYADTSGTEISFDGDYGRFHSTGESYQPNNYYDPNKNLLYSIVTGNSTPTDISIYTAKADVEHKFLKGKLGYGIKFAYVKTSNAFDFFNYTNNVPVKSLSESNSFVYTENVNAAYLNYNREFNSKWSLQTGLRLEQTGSEGNLTRADGVTQSDNTVKRNYINLFPSAAISYNINSKNSMSLNYSRRIDRPGYQDLNPFENKLDQLTYEKGNAFLKPQYTDVVELSHTFKSRITTTVGYNYVKDYATQITNTVNRNATYVQQQNIATQQIFTFNMASPLTITKWWSGYANVWYNYQVVKGSYDTIKLNIKAPDYGAYMQNTFNLGKDYSAEISGWLNGPGLEGTWKRKTMGGMDIGFQKLFLQKKLSLKASVTDVLNTIHFRAKNVQGAYLDIDQQGENRTVRLTISYRFGSNQIKAARQRKSGLESEGNRIK